MASPSASDAASVCPSPAASSVRHTLDEFQEQHEENRRRTKLLGALFVEKVPQIVKDKTPEKIDDPLGIYNPAAEVVEPPSPTVKAPPRRKAKRRPQANIFRDFGTEHNNGAFQEVEIDGVIVKRVNYKAFFQSDHDLHRWKQNLRSLPIADRLLDGVRRRWHEDFHADRADLVANHTSFARKQAEGKRLQHGLDPKETILNPLGKSSDVQKIVELQRLIAPDQPKRRKKRRNLPDTTDVSGADDNDVSHRSRKRAEPTVNPAQEAIYDLLEFLLRDSGSLEDVFDKIDRNGNGMLSSAEFSSWLKDSGFDGDCRLLWRLLNVDQDGLLNRQEFLNLKPYMQQAISRQQQQISGETVDLQDITKDELHDSQVDAGGRHGGRGMEADECLPLTSTAGDRQPLSVPTSPQESGRCRLQSFGSADDGQQEQQQQQQQRQQNLKTLSNISQMSISKWQPALIPQTLALLLFRNADRLHAGETCFVSRWPLPSLRDLLEACGRACRPVVGPAESLLTTALLPVRSLREVKNGGVYLLKGHERLAPPLLFLDHPEPQRLASSASAPSLRSLSMSRLKMQADREFRCSSPGSSPGSRVLHATAFSGEDSLDLLHPRDRDHQTSQGSYAPAADSPLRTAARKALGRRWQAQRQLGLALSWGGLGQVPRHHDFLNWEPALGDRKSGRNEQEPATTS